jgi:TonB family protein
MLRDLETVLYSYTPAPGSADLAIYLNRLREAQASAGAAPAAAVAREAAQPAPSRPPSQPAAPAAAETPPTPEAARPAAGGGVFGSFSPSRIEAEKSKRLPIYIGIAAVLLIGGLLALLLGRKSAPPSPETAPPPASTPLSVASVLPPVVEAAPTAPPLDSKGIEQEVQRQLAARREEIQKAGRPTPTHARRPTSAPVVLPTEAPIARLEPTELPPPPTAPPPEPTVVVAVREEPPPTREPAPAAAPPEPAVARGDLVGPGPGVVEPALVTPPRILYPPMARQQKVSGRVVILVLVNENGGVSDARIQKGLGGRTGIDSLVLEAVRGSRFRPATKDGIPVKMWRTVVVDVKP